MSANDGNDGEPLKLGEKLFIRTQDGAELEYEVVGVLEDPDEGAAYAVLMHEGSAHEGGSGDNGRSSGATVEEESDEDDDDFIVTDLQGNLLEDDELAQEVLDEFITFAEEAGDEGSA